MRRTIFIDIETLPALNLSASGSPPVKTASSDENHLKTALNGDFGRLLCIGFIDEPTHRNQPIYDTMMEWERWSFGHKVSLDWLARVLNLPPSKEWGLTRRGSTNFSKPVSTA